MGGTTTRQAQPKSGTASTLSVVSGAKQAMANVLKTVTTAVNIKEFREREPQSVHAGQEKIPLMRRGSSLLARRTSVDESKWLYP